MRKIALVVVASLLTTSCTEQDTEQELEPKEADLFVVGEPGKADAMLPAADQARLEAAFDSAIAAAEANVVKLENEIATLEASHAAKQREADAIVARIAQREQELRNSFQLGLLLCVFIPNPLTCIFVNYVASDAAMRNYNTQLAAARAEQSRIALEISRYRVKRDGLRAKIVPVREGKQQLLTMLRSGSTAVIPPELMSSPETGTAFWRAQVMGQVSTAIGTEIGLLVEIRNLAVELSQTLDESLRTLRALEHSVDDLVAQQRRAFMDHLVGFLTGDPAALADQWLEDLIASRTRELLDKLNWPLNELARFLAETRGDGSDVEALVQRLLEKLLAGDGVPAVIAIADTPVEILDPVANGPAILAKSPVTITQQRPIRSLEVFVDIKHSFVGDLKVWLQKGDKQFTLSNRVGGNQHDLVKTYMITDLQGATLSGQWTLFVQDQAVADSGTLRRWSLTAR